MKSTELIHDIITQFGDPDNNQDLYRALKALRTQTKLEVLNKIKNCTNLIKLLYK